MYFKCLTLTTIDDYHKVQKQYFVFFRGFTTTLEKSEQFFCLVVKKKLVWSPAWYKNGVQ